MILKGFCTYLRFGWRGPLKYMAVDVKKVNMLTTNINFLQSTQKPSINEQNKKKKYFSKSRAAQKEKNDNNAKTNEDNLTRIIKFYRIRMEQTDDKTNEITHHAKKIADYYKAFNHAEFVQQKSQLENILQKITQLKLSNLDLLQYCHLLDFIRICSNIESISRPIFIKTQQKVFGKLKDFQRQIQDLPLNELAIIYCKVMPVYHPDAFTISGLLHDKLASDWQESKRVNLSFMQLYVIIRSMSRKQFLSFPDKKILEMLLLSIKDKKIDPSLIIQFATALKDIQVEVNISDDNICEISRKIQARAVRAAQRGLQLSQIQHLIHTSKSENPYFSSIFQILAKKSLSILANEETSPALIQFKQFVDVVKMIPSSYRFSLEERKAIVKICERYLSKEESEDNKRQFQMLLLDLIRYDFFRENLPLLDNFFIFKKVKFIWSFPYQYSKRSIPFPLESIEEKITENTSSFKLQASNMKISITVAIQAKLNSESQVLQKCYRDTIIKIKQYEWSRNDVNFLVKTSIFDFYLISIFHDLFYSHFLPALTPTADQIKKDRQIKKGERSQLFKFWEYIMNQNQISYDLVAKIPIFAIYLTAFREKNVKNQQIHPKIVLLQAINLQLSWGKIKFSDNECSNIIEMLSLYSSNLNAENESQCEQYWNCVINVIDQYGYIRKTAIPSVNHLISKLLHLSNTKIRNSIYYKNFLMELIKAVGLLTISNSHDYFKTSIIRQGLRNNLISDFHLPQLELAYFTPQEKKMLTALLGKYNEDQFNPDNLVIYFKLPKLPQGIATDIERIIEVIDNSTSQQLSEYLIHYSFQYNKFGERILTKICQKFVANIDLASINVLALLRNLMQLSNSNFKLFEKVLVGICDKALNEPEAIYLGDHCEILKILHEYKIYQENYQVALWELAKKKSTQASSYIKIMLQLLRKQNIQISQTDLEQAENYLLSNPEELLKIFVYNEESIPNLQEKLRLIVPFFNKPINQSLFLAYLESKYEFIVAKAKTSVPILSRANFATNELFKLLEAHGVSVKGEEKHGENIYLINNKIILIFTMQRYGNECKTISKMMRHLYPKQDIIEINAEGGIKDNTQILQQLRIINREVFSSDLIQKLEYELQLK